MNKSLYSLVLMDSVVAGIDKLAMREGTNRSNLVNQILAEYLSLMTPEKRIDSIFKNIENLLTQDSELIPFVVPNHTTMSMKSSLEYKYRPTIKYEVSLYRAPDGAIGELGIIFRTQSQTLLTEMTNFFKYWVRLENAFIAKLYGNSIDYSIQDGRFTRSISLPKNKNYTNEELGQAISAYVKMFDELMKGYLNKKYTPEQIENLYIAYLNRGIGLI